jgi:POT family proton-dependent oligopeptide transporter
MFFWGAFEQAGSSLTFIANNQTDTRILGWTMPPSMVQSFNGIFVMVFAIPFSFLWVWMNKKRLEPISPVKQAWGLLLIALGYLIIATQVKGLGIAGKIGIIWMVILYLLHTWGELCLSPIGLSLVAKLAQKVCFPFDGCLVSWKCRRVRFNGCIGALLPPTTEAYISMEKQNINLKQVLDGRKYPTAQNFIHWQRKRSPLQLITIRP